MTKQIKQGDTVKVNGAWYFDGQTGQVVESHPSKNHYPVFVNFAGMPKRQGVRIMSNYLEMVS